MNAEQNAQNIKQLTAILEQLAEVGRQLVADQKAQRALIPIVEELAETVRRLTEAQETQLAMIQDLVSDSPTRLHVQSHAS